MTFALLVLLSAVPDAGTLSFKETVEAPVVSELYSRKPNSEKSTGGKVLPEFASPAAFAKSSHASKSAWTDVQRAAFDTLVELAGAKKPELADPEYKSEGHPLQFKRLSELALKPNPRAKVVTNRMDEAVCCGDSGPGSVELVKSYPARVRRDGEGRIDAVLLRDENFSTKDNHGGRVTEKNAHLHENEWRVFMFDDGGRVTAFASFLRSDHQMRLGPQLELKVCSVSWSGSAIVDIDCQSSKDGGDEFTFVTQRRVWRWQ